VKQRGVVTDEQHIGLLGRDVELPGAGIIERHIHDPPAIIIGK